MRSKQGKLQRLWYSPEADPLPAGWPWSLARAGHQLLSPCPLKLEPRGLEVTELGLGGLSGREGPQP